MLGIPVIFIWGMERGAKIPTATGGVLPGGILGRIQLANAIES